MEEFSDERFKQCAVIEFLTAEKVPPIETHTRMQAIYGDQCVDVSTVKTLGKAAEEVKLEVRKWFEKQNTNFFKDGFQKLVQSVEVY